MANNCSKKEDVDKIGKTAVETIRKCHAEIDTLNPKNFKGYENELDITLFVQKEILQPIYQQIKDSKNKLNMFLCGKTKK